MNKHAPDNTLQSSQPTNNFNWKLKWNWLAIWYDLHLIFQINGSA